LELKNKEIILKEQQKEIMQLEAAYKKNERLLFILSILLLTIIIFVLSNFLLRRLKRHRSSLKEIAHIQSHEARAPLVRILGLIQLLDYKDYTALDKEQVLSYIKQSALELDDVIKKIVDKTDCVPENQRKKHLFNVTFRKK
jgi:signal transduction histidine kinase